MTAKESQELGRALGILEGHTAALTRIEQKLDKKASLEHVQTIEGRVETLELRRGSLQTWAVALLTVLLVNGSLVFAHVALGLG